ncbi:MAG: ribonuclease HIII [candidate division Zixibacteria bacterium]|nr:ribonuclease HIII [candidate division Zixibacteria bacterium]
MENKKAGSGEKGANKIGSFSSDKNKSRHSHSARPSFSHKESFMGRVKDGSREKKPEKSEPEVKAPHKPTGWIGTDESGKGDYFGPLVVAGVYLEDNLIPQLRQLNVRDSKKISDGVIKDLDFRLRSICRYSVVVIGPEKYNLLYSRMKNLNRILAWGHARVIENILLQVDASRALSDQFGDELYIKNALMKLGKKIRLEQRPGAESDLAVAAASILARAEFLNRLEGLSRECGMVLPKGASPQTEEAARKLVEKLGKENLEKYVKMHFKNTLKVLSPSPQKEEPAAQS